MLLSSSCIEQAGCLSNAQRRELEATLRGAVQTHVSPEARLVVAWLTIPSGSGFAAGKPSKSLLVQVGVPDGFDQTAREALMHELNGRICRVTGQTPFELMISATDQTAGRRMIKTMFAQIPLSQKPKFLMDHVPRAIRGLLAGR